MKHKVILIVAFLFSYFVETNAQKFEISVGTSFNSVYTRKDIKHNEPFNYIVDYSLNPSLLVGIGFGWDLAEQYEIRSEFIYKYFSGESNGIKIGYSPIDSTDIFGGWDFSFHNIEAIISLRKYFDLGQSWQIYPVLSVGYSLNISGEQIFTEPAIVYIIPPLPPYITEEPDNNNTGILTKLGLGCKFYSFLFQTNVGWNFYDTFVYSSGNIKSFSFEMKIGIIL